MATHSSTLTWKIPWTEEPGRLQSMGSLRVGHDWATSLSLFLSCIGEGNGNPLPYSCLENPRTGEPGGLLSMGLHRVGHDWETSLFLFLSCIGEGNGNPLQCSCLENPRDGGAWWATYSPWGLKESDTTERTHSHFNQLWEGTLDSINDIWDLSAAYTEVFVYLK